MFAMTAASLLLGFERSPLSPLQPKGAAGRMARGRAPLAVVAAASGSGKPPRRVGIIGAGIGGLTLAVALDKLGSGADTIKVYDRRPTLEPTLGGSLNMNSGAVVLAKLGLGDDFRALSNPWSRLRSRTVEGFDLVEMEVKDALATASDPDELYYQGAPMAGAIMRGELQQLLASRLPPSAEIQLSKDLVGLEEGPGGVVASFADGSSEEFDLVVGADGIRSAARGIMFGSNSPNFSGIRVQFGVKSGGGVRTREEEVHQWFGDGAYTLTLTAGGAGARNDIIAVCQHVEAEAAGDENPNWDASEVRGEALATLERLNFPPEDRFFDLGVCFHDPMPTWRPRGSERMVLLGDACHAMPPFLGQGANQAVQDAYSLALKLSQVGGEYGTVGGALDAYYAVREPPSTALMQSSRGMGFIETLGGPLGVLVRNTGIFFAGKVGVPKFIFSSGATPRGYVPPFASLDISWCAGFAQKNKPTYSSSGKMVPFDC